MGHAPGPAQRKRSRSRAGGEGGLGHDGSADQPAKHLKWRHEPRDTIVKHALLTQYYSEIQTLRRYTLSKLPASSRIRRRKIASLGSGGTASENPRSEDELALGELLDSTVVARRQPVENDNDHRWKQWVGFSQKGDESYVTLSDGLGGSVFSQSEIVDFVVWLLFSRESTGSWPKHLLCDGFRRRAGPNNKPDLASATTIPGLCSVYPNQHVQALKAPPWPQLLMLLGKEGERIMIDLLVDCAMFKAVKAGKGNLYQLCGIPVSELEPLWLAGNKEEREPLAMAKSASRAELRPSDISFVRSRMLYARAALNARGLVLFGLRHIHVLNRFPHKGSLADVIDQPDESAIHIMMYIFPRQFGLHNVFTSTVDRQQTAQKFQDYTLREEEIARKFPAPGSGVKPTKHVPKRLRGKAVGLIQRLQVLHKRCSYAEMLHHYCPVPGQVGDQREVQTASSKTVPPSSRLSAKSGKDGKKPKSSTVPIPHLRYSSLTELATPVSNVSAFCQTVVSKVIPDEFWGQGTTQRRNKACFLNKVHHFIHLRRFESMCLHEVMQGMKTSNLEWLTPPKLVNQKSSQSDMRKRTEIYYELLYYLFDSFVIPLIRSNFYVTESSVDRYRLFFFRHDIWRYVAEPAMAVLKTNMFEEVKMEDALRILQSRRLGYSLVRLLPKQSGMRPIMNLRRRMFPRGDSEVLGPSINSILGPVNSMLKLEKSRDPRRLGSSLFSVGDIYQRIKAFRSRLGNGRHEFYFAKVDVRAAFDTIPQDAIIELLKRIPQQSQYEMLKHVEVCLLETASGNLEGAKPSKRWHTIAKASNDKRTFLERTQETLAAKKKHTIFVNSAVQKAHDTSDLLALTAAHIQQNLVRIGKKYYRQNAGIPQGSVLSSTLCNYFYAELERNHLAFLVQAEDCLLLRLIDDFLLITTDEDKARRFVGVMHGGLPEYGVTVNPDKSLVNFPLAVRGTRVPRIDGSTRGFPYCGLLIDCRSLAVGKHRDRAKDTAVFNSLTVEYSRCPGRNFKRKVINAFKLQSHLMFFDTSHNSRRGVLGNIYSSCVETATKMWAYARCMVARPGTAVVIDTIKTLVDVAFVLLTSRARSGRYPGYVCSVRKGEVAWLAMVACRQVLGRKQTSYKEVVAWLQEETLKLGGQKGVDVHVLVGVAKALPVGQRAKKRRGLPAR